MKKLLKIRGTAEVQALPERRKIAEKEEEKYTTNDYWLMKKVLPNMMTPILPAPHPRKRKKNLQRD